MAVSEIYDKIFIKHLLVPCNVGVEPEERASKQTVLIDIEVYLDRGGSVREDDIGKTLSYTQLRRDVSGFVTIRPYVLLETMGEDIASIVMAKNGVRRVKVMLVKERFSTEPEMGVEISRGHID